MLSFYSEANAALSPTGLNFSGLTHSVSKSPKDGLQSCKVLIMSQFEIVRR